MSLERFRHIAYEIIKEEKLPKLIELKFRAPLGGCLKRLGTCFRINDDLFKIIIYTTKARWFKDEKGTYLDRNTKCAVRRASVGEKVSHNELKNTIAHEIAHMKYWKHGKNHKQYTEKIFKMIKTKLGEK